MTSVRSSRLRSSRTAAHRALTFEAELGLGKEASASDVVVGTGAPLGAPSLAEYVGIPWVFAALAPSWFPSRHHGPAVVPAAGPKWLNSFSWWFVRGAWSLLFKAVINRGRANLGLPGARDLWSQLLGTKGSVPSTRSLLRSLRT